MYQAEFAGAENCVDDIDLNTNGVTFVASSGDDGQPSGYPAYSPNVVSVSGTSLYLDQYNAYASEIGWNLGSNSSDATVAGGGGVSQFEQQPSYQANVQSTGQRTGPDVTFVGDPHTGVTALDSFNNAGL